MNDKFLKWVVTRLKVKIFENIKDQYHLFSFKKMSIFIEKIYGEEYYLQTHSWKWSLKFRIQGKGKEIYFTGEHLESKHIPRIFFPDNEVFRNIKPYYPINKAFWVISINGPKVRKQQLLNPSTFVRIKPAVSLEDINDKWWER